MSSPAEPDVDARADVPGPADAADAVVIPPDTPPGFITRLAEAMLDAGEVTKSARNNEQGYNYASAEAILAAVRAPLLRRGIILLAQPRDFTEHEIRSRSGTAGTRVVIEVDYTFRADDGELVVERWRGEGQDYGDKAYGKAYTNALKTLIRSEWLLPTDTGDDPEASPSGERIAAGAAPELPPWARNTNAGRRRELGEALVPLIGVERARVLARTVNDSLGVIPDVVVSFAKGLVSHYALEGPGDVDERHRALYAATRQRNEEAAAAAEAQAERAAADAGQAAAEDPDAPAPDIPADVEPESAEDPAPDDLELNAQAAAQAAGDDRPPAGSIDTAGELPDDLVDAARTGDPAAIADVDERLRALGCVCKNPAAVELELGDVPARGISDECALKGHGIPF